MHASRAITAGRIQLVVPVAVLAMALSSCGSEGPTATPTDRHDSSPNSATGGPVDSLAPTAISYAVAGVVRDASGKPVTGVMITPVSLDRPAHPVPELAVLSDARGHYGWPGLKPGRYEMRVATPTGKAAVQVKVPPNGGATADLTLREL